METLIQIALALRPMPEDFEGVNFLSGLCISDTVLKSRCKKSNMAEDASISRLDNAMRSLKLSIESCKAAVDQAHSEANGFVRSNSKSGHIIYLDCEGYLQGYDIGKESLERVPDTTWRIDVRHLILRYIVEPY